MDNQQQAMVQNQMATDMRNIGLAAAGTIGGVGVIGIGKYVIKKISSAFEKKEEEEEPKQHKKA